MDRYEFFKEWYHQENSRHASLNDSLNIPIGILTGIFAVFFFYVTGFIYNPVNINLVLFIIGLLLMISFCLITVVFLFRSYNNLMKGYKYKFLPEATKWEERLNELRIYYETNKSYFGPRIDANANEHLQDEIAKSFATCLDNNVFLNDKKSGYLHSAKQYLFLALICTMLTSIPFGYNYFTKPEKSEKIEVTNIEVLNQKIEKLTQLLNTNTMSNPKPPPPPPPPRERLIKEGDQPKMPTPPPPQKPNN